MQTQPITSKFDLTRPVVAGTPWDETLREIQKAWAEAYQEERQTVMLTSANGSQMLPVSARPGGC